MLGFLLLFSRCADIENQYTISGNTMGTTYLIKIVTSDNNYKAGSIKKSIDSLLIELNNMFDQNSRKVCPDANRAKSYSLWLFF